MNSITVVKALADLNRLRVMWLLNNKKELCVCQITEVLGLATPTVSKHMAILHNAGLVNSRKESRWVYYSLGEQFSIPKVKEFILWTMEDEKELIEIDLRKSINCISNQK